MKVHHLALPYAYAVLCGLTVAVLLVRVAVCSRRNRREFDKRVIALFSGIGFAKLSLGVLTLLIAPEAVTTISVLIAGGLLFLLCAGYLIRTMRGKDYCTLVYLSNPDACGRCGYNLTGNLSGVCPECGWKLPERKG